MSQKKLTRQLLANLKPANAEYAVQDSINSALSVRVRPSGNRSFQVRYRVKGEGRRGRVCRHTIGNVEDISLTEARRIASEVRSKATLGIDPGSEQIAKRQEVTVAELCDQYLQDGVTTKKPSTIATDRGRIERHIKPLLGRKRVSDVSQVDVERFMRDVAEGKTKADVKTGHRGRAIVTGGKGTASRTVGLLGGIFTFAVRCGLCSNNPVRNVKRFPDQRSERFLSDSEIEELGSILRDFEGRGANAFAIMIIRLALLTGLRKSEIAALRWSEVDLERSYLNLGDSKTGQKTIPLGAPALALLESVPIVDWSGFVFPATHGSSHYVGTDKVWKQVRAELMRRLESGGGNPVRSIRFHDLRHSYASVAAASGDSLPVIGKLLGHKDVKTTSRYAHLADDPLRASSTRTSRHIADALAGLPVED